MYIYGAIIIGSIILFIYLYNAKKQADQNAQFNAILNSGNQQIATISGQQNGLVSLAGTFTGTDLISGVFGGSSSGSSNGSSSGGSTKSSGGTSWTSFLAFL